MKAKPKPGTTAQNVSIGSVTFSPATPRAGESVKIEVHTDPPNSPMQVSINGVPGAVRYVVWERPGKKHVFIVATMPQGKVIDRRREIVEVLAAPSGYPRLRSERLLESPTTLRFSVEIPTQRLQRTTGTLNSFRGIRQPKLGRVQGHGLAKSLPGGESLPPTFEWDFGEGFVVGTTLPSFAHDFGPDLSRSQERESFHVAVRVVAPGKPMIEIRRTISVVNPYAIAKRRGFLQPPVQQDLNAHLENGAFRGKLTVQNPESFEITLSSRRVEVFFASGHRASLLYPKQPTNRKLKAQTETVFTTHATASQIPKDAVGFAVHYGGTANKMPVRVSAYFDIPSRWWRAAPLLPEGFQVLLRSVAARKMTPNPKQIAFRHLEDLVRRGELALPQIESGDLRASALGCLASVARTGPVQKPLSGHIEPSLAKEGAECDPTNLPDDIPEGFVCQATSETRFVPMPGRFMNAKKGDAVLSPGGTGLIGGLLRQVEPGQNYSHSGIMTRNHDEITHSTASEDRLLDYPIGSFLGEPAPTDGHRPDVLKYQWPGVITQTVEAAVHGEEFADPESNKTYKISGFEPNNKKIPDSGELIPPLVVKPDPMIETPEHRSRLHEAANVALDQQGNAHYRFFCYTDPTIGLDETAPDEAGWAAGTHPTVCSSFVWMCLREADFSFEGGHIEEADKQKGAEFGPDHEDGLYLYTAEERLTAGEWLYGALYDMVVEQAEIAGPEGLMTALTDMPDDVANQILNTFASDWSDTEAKDSEAWKSTAEARAVSPDNILFWDPPDKGGPYGYLETLVYRPPRYELVTVHRWKHVQFTGTLKGLVRFNGQPVEGAQVQIYDGKFAATGSNGRFVLKTVPVGDYILQVAKFQDGLYLTASIPVTVKKDEDTAVTLDMKPPEDLYRAVTVEGWMLTVDDEWNAAANPYSYKDFYAVMRVNPFDTHDEVTFSDVCDGDVRSEFHVEADWNLDKSVTLAFTARIFESADPADGIDSEITRSMTVSPGGTGHWEGMKVYNDDDDSLGITFDAKNDVQVT